MRVVLRVVRGAVIPKIQIGDTTTNQIPDVGHAKANVTRILIAQVWNVATAIAVGGKTPVFRMLKESLL